MVKLLVKLTFCMVKLTKNLPKGKFHHGFTNSFTISYGENDGENDGETYLFIPLNKLDFCVEITSKLNKLA